MRFRLLLLVALGLCAAFPGLARADAKSVERGLDAARAPRAQLAEPLVRGTRTATFFSAQQKVDGVPVLGATVVVTDAPGTQGDLVIDRTRAGVADPGAPAVSRRGALSRARNGLAGAERARSRALLALRPEAGGRERLVWRVTLTQRRPARDLEILVDAKTGAVVSRRDLRQGAFTATGTGQVFDPNPSVTPGGTFPGAESGGVLDEESDTPELTAARRPEQLYRLNTEPTVSEDGLTSRSGCLDGRWVRAFRTEAPITPTPVDRDVCDPGRVFSFTREDDRFEPVMAYFHIDRAAEYLNRLGFSAALPQPNSAGIKVYANGDPEANAYYSPTAKYIVMGVGGVDSAEDADVLVHEYGHAVQDAQKPGYGESAQAGAMGEGFGDYLAAALSAERAAPGDREGAVCLAEWFSLSFGERCLRRMDSPRTAAQVGPGTTCDAEVHCAGEVWSAALWQLRGSLGGGVMDRLVLQSHYSVPTTGTFNDGSRAILAADQARYGGAHLAQLKSVLRQRGLLVDTDADGRPDSSDSCPDTADDGADSDGDGRGNACDPTPNGEPAPPAAATAPSVAATAPVRDSTAPRVLLARFLASSRAVSFRVRASETSSGLTNVYVTGATARRLGLTKRRVSRYRIGTAKVSLTANRTKVVRVAVSARVGRALRRRATSRLTVRVLVRDAARNAARASRVVTYRRAG